MKYTVVGVHFGCGGVYGGVRGVILVVRDTMYRRCERWCRYIPFCVSLVGIGVFGYVRGVFLVVYVVLYIRCERWCGCVPSNVST